MVGCGDHDYVTGKLVKLHQQERDNSLDLTSLMGVTALLTDRIKLIEEKDTGCGAHIVEKLAQTGVRLTEIAAKRTTKKGRPRPSAIASANDVLPLPGGPDSSTRWRGSKPLARSTSARRCSSISCRPLSRAGKGSKSSSNESRASISKMASRPLVPLRCGDVAVSAGGVTGTPDNARWIRSAKM